MKTAFQTDQATVRLMLFYVHPCLRVSIPTASLHNPWDNVIININYPRCLPVMVAFSTCTSDRKANKSANRCRSSSRVFVVGYEE